MNAVGVLSDDSAARPHSFDDHTCQPASFARAHQLNDQERMVQIVVKTVSTGEDILHYLMISVGSCRESVAELPLAAQQETCGSHEVGVRAAAPVLTCILADPLHLTLVAASFLAPADPDGSEGPDERANGDENCPRESRSFHRFSTRSSRSRTLSDAECGQQTSKARRHSQGGMASELRPLDGPLRYLSTAEPYTHEVQA
jgi:hypothetical protein